MMEAIVPLLAALVGLLMYVLAANAKLQEVGRILLATGCLVALYVAANHVVHIP